MTEEQICPNCHKKSDSWYYCKYCGCKLGSIEKKSQEILSNHQTKNDVESDKKDPVFSFCDKCGKLLLPSKNDNYLYCECGETKVINKSYKVSKNLNYEPQIESIFRCICGKKFNSTDEFFAHRSKCRELTLEDKPQSSRKKKKSFRNFSSIEHSNPYLYHYLKEKEKESERKRQRIIEFRREQIAKLSLATVKKEKNIQLDKYYAFLEILNKAKEIYTNDFPTCFIDIWAKKNNISESERIIITQRAIREGIIRIYNDKMSVNI
jgi:hypothetical protein